MTERETETQQQTPPPPAVKLPWPVRRELADALLAYPDNVSAYDRLFRDLAQSGGDGEDDGTFQRHLLAQSDPTANRASVCYHNTELRDLWRLIREVETFRDSLSPRLARVLAAAFLDRRYRNSGAAVVARRSGIGHSMLFDAKNAILVEFARFKGWV